MRATHVASPLPILVVAAAAMAPAHAGAQEGQTVPEDTVTAVEQAVLEANRRMSEAADSFDLDTFFGYIASEDGATIIQDGEVFASLDAARSSVEAGYRGLRRIERQYESPTVTVLSPDAALLASAGRIMATLDDGRTITGRFAVSLLFVRRDDGWKVLHGHYSRPNQPF